MSDIGDRTKMLSPEKRALLESRLRKSGAVPSPAHAIPRRTSDGLAPLSFAQERLWFLSHLEPNGAAYNVPFAHFFAGPLALPALEQALAEIIDRHEPLRTIFLSVKGTPRQVITPGEPLALPMIDLSGWPEAEREAQMLRYAVEAAQQPFDFAEGPPFRVVLLRLTDTAHVLLVTLHHIISDGWSIGVFKRELDALYTAYSAELPSPLPELPIQYADYAVWQREWLQGAALDTQLAYWKEHLTGAPPLLMLPTDHPRPPIQSFRGAIHPFDLPPDLTDKLTVLARQEGVTLFMVLLAAWQTLLARYSGQEDIVVGTPIANRTRRELEGLIGFFANTLVLRTDLSGNPPFRELLRRVRATALGAYAHQDLPFEKLVEELHPVRDLSRNPLFQVMFVLHNTPPAETAPGEIALADADSGAARFDLTVFLTESAHGLHGTVEYKTDLYDAPTIARMAGHFQTILEGAVADPSQRLWELPLLTAGEEQQLLVDWNATQAEYPQDQCLHQLFEAQVERTPDHLAVLSPDERLTYREVNGRANQLAHHLQTLGVGPGVRVGVCMERSAALVVALLGVLKAGGAYVPLDPAYPRERLIFMLNDAAVPVLLTQQAILDRLPLDDTGAIIRTERDGEAIARESATNPASAITADDIAYVIYTSGSTGTPKGVLAPHRGIVNRLHWMWTHYPYRDGEVCCQKTSTNFVDAVSETFGPLLRGIPLIVAPENVAKDLQEFVHLLVHHQITRIVLVPSLLRALFETFDDLDTRLPYLTLWFVSGEALPTDLAERFHATLPGCALVNLYGSSEVAADATWYETHPRESSPIVPIGRPIANMRAYVLDAHRELVPVGVPGELYLGGAGLAHGYLHRPTLTAERFVPYPFAAYPGERLYKTGDAARYRPDGTLEFLGRLDNQVKIRGVRVELEEIEAVLGGHPAVREIAVAAREAAENDVRLIAYVVPHDGAMPSADALRRFATEKLPQEMIPAAFVPLETLPLTPNGKVDRGALPALDASRPNLEAAFVAPQGRLERGLAALWEEVLGIQPIGMRDNFFDIGGHSLLATRLFAQIEERFGKWLPLTTLFHAPTVQQMAAILLQEGWAAPFSSVVPIQPEGDHPPFFCVHGFGGSVVVFADLAQHLGYDQPFYGLQPRELDGIHEPFARMEEMAAHYISEMRIIQPEGPYYLGGFSDGGIIAFEMAQQLRAIGEDVALLAILDGGAPNYWKIRWNGAFVAGFLTDFPYAVDAFVRLGPKGMRARTAMHGRVLGKIARASLAIRLRHLDIEPPKAGIEYLLDVASQMPEQMRKHTEPRKHVLLNYVPQVYPGRITVLRTHAQPILSSHDRRLGWGDLAGGGIDLKFVPGKHHTMLQQPYVRGAARCLRAVLAKARDEYA